jgi:hypothetical protein
VCHGELPEYRVPFARVGSTEPPSNTTATASRRSSNDKLTGVLAVIIGTYWNRIPPILETSATSPSCMTWSISAASGRGSKNRRSTANPNVRKAFAGSEVELKSMYLKGHFRSSG